MYLRNIKLAGFKSFVDPVTIPVRSNMSAIVGPNGCGKSNIVDAIRWVIGESSAKQLRGQSMSDVIFNGTTGRNAVGRAIVELHFDNSSNRLTGEYAGYTDIAIRREVERDGQSRYFLNGTSCRRKDILDIFLGTGLGPRSYSIIEQGMISRLIEAKPEDMRVYFEEVAGISKYKERRRETENRIHHTEENLNRLNDIREELTKQLRHLQRQANAAEKYQALKQEARELSAQIKALNWQFLQQKREQSQEDIREKERARLLETTLLRDVEADIDKTKINQENSTEEMGQVQKQYYTLGEEIARLEQQIKSHKDQSAAWQKELKDVNTAWNELNENTLEYTQQIEELTLEVSELAPKRGQTSEKANAAKFAFREADTKMQQWNEVWDEFQEQSSRLLLQTQASETNVTYLQQQITKLKQRQDNLEKEANVINLEMLKTEITPLKEQLNQLNTELNENKAKSDDNQDQIALTRSKQKNLQQQLQTARQLLQTEQSEHAKQDGLQQAALGLTDQAINSWINANALQAHRRLGQVIKVKPGFEIAVETVLSGYFDAVCVEDVNAFSTKVSEIKNGRVTLIDKTMQEHIESSDKFTTLMSQVESEWPFNQWMQGIYVAENEADAQGMRKNLSAGESIVTKNGVWFGKNWMRVSKVKDPQSGIIAREAKLNALTMSIKTQQKTIEQLLQHAQATEVILQELENARDELQKIHKSLTEKGVQTQAQLNKKEVQLESLTEQQARLQVELNDVSSQIQNSKQDLIHSKKEFERLNHQKSTFSAKREQLLKEKEVLRITLEDKRTSAQNEQQFADELEIRVSASESQLALLRQTLQRDEKQLTNLLKRRDDLECKLHQDDSPLIQFEQDLQRKLSERLQLEKALNSAQNTLNDLRLVLKTLEEKKQTTQKQIELIQSQIQQLQIEGQEVIVRSQTIKEQLEESGNNLNEVMARLQSDADVKTWEGKLNEINQRISRLGPINLAAINEHKDAEERKEYLDKQYQDLTESLELLQGAIAKIDQKTKIQFRDTFDKVNQEFKAIFPRMFGGGLACLEMTENNLLKTGIFVKAQPPGKRNASIHMLSGGEKALTAIALVFAMFSLNPAPFCILDEVDAPLDDLNVGRFCQLVREMAKETQFLIISHNKVTIETADHLMGVTMQEAGVSRLVAVDMEEALQMVETA